MLAQNRPAANAGARRSRDISERWENENCRFLRFLCELGGSCSPSSSQGKLLLPSHAAKVHDSQKEDTSLPIPSRSQVSFSPPPRHPTNTSLRRGNSSPRHHPQQTKSSTSFSYHLTFLVYPHSCSQPSPPSSLSPSNHVLVIRRRIPLLLPLSSFRIVQSVSHHDPALALAVPRIRWLLPLLPDIHPCKPPIHNHPRLRRRQQQRQEEARLSHLRPPLHHQRTPRSPCTRPHRRAEPQVSLPRLRDPLLASGQSPATVSLSFLALRSFLFVSPSSSCLSPPAASHTVVAMH